MGRAVDDSGVRIGREAPHELRGQRRGGRDDVRRVALAKREQQIVPAFLRVHPVRDLVAPREPYRQASNYLGLLTGPQARDDAVGPGDFHLRRFVNRLEPWLGGRHDARLALDHDVAHVGCRLANERYLPTAHVRVVLGHHVTRLGPAARLAEPATGHPQDDELLPRRVPQLLDPTPERPLVEQPRAGVVAELAQRGDPTSRAHRPHERRYRAEADIALGQPL